MGDPGSLECVSVALKPGKSFSAVNSVVLRSDQKACCRLDIVETSFRVLTLHVKDGWFGH